MIQNMWLPVISILWTIVNLVQRKFTTKSVMYSTLNETTGNFFSFNLLVECWLTRYLKKKIMK